MPKRKHEALTDAIIRRAKVGKHFDGSGLFIEVTPAGKRYWRFKYRVNGKEKRSGFGVWPEVSIAEARKRTMQARRALREAKGPNKESIGRKIAEATSATRRRKKKLEVSFYIPNETLALLNGVVDSGILGHTLDEVVDYVLRHYMFEYWKAEQAVIKANGGTLDG